MFGINYSIYESRVYSGGAQVYSRYPNFERLPAGVSNYIDHDRPRQLLEGALFQTQKVFATGRVERRTQTRVPCLSEGRVP